MTMRRRAKRPTHRCSYCAELAVVIGRYYEKQPYKAGRWSSARSYEIVRYACATHVTGEEFLQLQRERVVFVNPVEWQ